jgi:hypothetical protein
MRNIKRYKKRSNLSADKEFLNNLNSRRSHKYLNGMAL